LVLILNIFIDFTTILFLKKPKSQADSDHSESGFLTQILSQIVVGFNHEKTFRDLGSGFVIKQN